ncbi:MAG: nucleotidyltransferase family protein [Betaproteobacteria bacterium]
MRIVGILLAGGEGARFGGAKLLAPLPVASHGAAAGTPIGAASCIHLMAALNEVVAVTRPRDPMLAGVLRDTGARVVECAHARDGMGASLACGVAAAPDADGWIVALADMPWIAPATIIRVVDTLDNGAEIVAPAWNGQRGHPVGFAKSYGPLLGALTGDDGARAVIAARQWVLQLVDVDDPGIMRDIDRPEDLHMAP